MFKKLINKLKLVQLVCNLGTNKKFWTVRQAEEWLEYTGKVTVIGKNKKVIFKQIRS